MDLNTATISGQLARHPIIQTAGSRVPVAWFTIENEYRYQDCDGRQFEDTAFVTCKAVGVLAMRLLGRRKGDFVHVTGRLRTETLRKRGKWQAELVLLTDSLEARRSATSSEVNSSKP